MIPHLPLGGGKSRRLAWDHTLAALMNSKRFDLGDEALVTYSYGTDRRQPYRRVTICGVFYRGVYDYLGVDATGVVTHLCDAWLAPSKIVIAEEVDLTDLFDGVSFPPMT